MIPMFLLFSSHIIYVAHERAQFFSFIKAICFSSLSSVHLSSLSQKAIYLPLALVIDWLRACPGPAFSLRKRILTRESFCAKSLSILMVSASVEASSVMSNSKFL